MLDFFRRLFAGSPQAEPPGDRHDVPVTAAPVTAASAEAAAGAANGSTRYVILGAGPAGVIASETLRKMDTSGDILLIHGEDGQPYSRMAIPYFLSNMIDEAGTELRKTPGHFRDLGIDVRHGWVEGISPDAGRLHMQGRGDRALRPAARRHRRQRGPAARSKVWTCRVCTPAGRSRMPETSSAWPSRGPTWCCSAPVSSAVSFSRRSSSGACR